VEDRGQMNRIVNGDILRFAAHYRGPRFHAVLCDPPYEISMMNKSWDGTGISFRSETWAAIGSLLAPGAHLLAFGGTRTFHRIAVAIEDAGFEIRDTIGYMYGSGFPKSHDVSKAIHSHNILGGSSPKKRRQSIMGDAYVLSSTYGTSHTQRSMERERSGKQDVLVDLDDDARAWQGYGTALKPAWEPVIVARKPLVGTVAQNCLAHGCGAINVDGGRVGDEPIVSLKGLGLNRNLNDDNWKGIGNRPAPTVSLGRWPANIIHDGSDETADVLGDAARFFYTAKASSRERDEGLAEFQERDADAMDGRSGRSGPLSEHGIVQRRNHHPTVKPLALTQYLATLILPPPHVESRILVPFAGSGSECIGAALAGWRTVVGVEREAEYAAIARARLEHWTRQQALPA
jgi:DNA modification methylase